MKKFSVKSIGLFILMALSMSFKMVKVYLFGELAEPIKEPKVGGTVCQPDTTISFNEWCKSFNVSKAVPKQIVMGKEEIATMLGIDSKYLVII